MLKNFIARVKEVTYWLYISFSSLIAACILAVAFLERSWMIAAFGIYYAYGSVIMMNFVIDNYKLKQPDSGYIGDADLLTDLSQNITIKLWNEIKLRNLFNETEYTMTEMNEDIKQNLEFINTYGFDR